MQIKKGFVRSVAINLGLSVFGIALALFIAEIGLRIAEKSSPAPKQEESPYISHGYYYTYRPNITFGGWENEAGGMIPFVTDQFGLRNTATDFQHSRTLLVLGDSFIEASNTTEENMFTTKLEEDLAIKTGMDLGVINAGVGGYSNAQSLFLLNEIWPEIESDWIILSVYLGNDLRDNCFGLANDQRVELGKIAPESNQELLTAQQAENADRVFNCPPATNLPSESNRILQAIQSSKVLSLLYNFFARPEVPTDDWLSYYTFEVETYRNAPAPAVVAAVENTRYILQQMSNFCRYYGVTCLIVGLPSKAEVYNEFSFVVQSEATSDGKERALDIIRDENGFSFDNPSEYYAQICAELNLPYFDLTPIFRQYLSSEIFYKIDSHWNAKAQGIAAQYLSDFMINEGMFGP